ncbi:hypothetical protein POL68_41985 [Stigmatella sp. ncwal1]|uniref:PAS domain-containing protein n=1 Tax=Stigmatella ashevillensis TaxID=2995309 RepID=A0ABT5DPM0_9BACT|nr:hypothetical protein [Stigmatella ashevillena]MDC0715093.1 hypothetical protein [Stigmatella ashevillena]
MSEHSVVQASSLWSLGLKFLAKIRAALRNGFGSYTTSMALMAVACFFARQVLFPVEQGMTQLNRLFRVEQEPSSSIKRPAMSAAIIGKHLTWTVCEAESWDEAKALKENPNSSPEQSSIREGGKVPDQIYALFMAHLNEEADIQPWDERFSALQALTTPEEQGRWSRPADPFPRLFEDDGREHSTLRIPSPLVPFSDSSGQQPSFRASFWRSLSLEALRPMLNKPAIELPSAHLPQVDLSQDVPVFKNFYFISMSGFLRSLVPLRTPLVAHHAFTESNAFQQTLLPTTEQPCVSRDYSKERYHSRPHIDMNGNGIVTTLCYRVADSHGRLGAFCTDISLPPRLIHQSLREQHLFKTTLVKVKEPSRKEDLPELTVCGQPGFTCPERAFEVSSDPERREARAAALQWWREFSGHPSNSGASDMTVTSGGHFAAAIHHSGLGNTDRYEIAFFKPAPRGIKDWVSFVSAVACLLGITALTVRCFFLKDQRRDSALIRGLPVGVVRFTEDGRIIAANDRAEELLRRPIPKFGVHDTSPWLPISHSENLQLADLVCDGKVYFRHGSTFVSGPLEKLRTQRREGTTGEYWARLDVTDGYAKVSWFRIIGSPILRPKGKGHVFCMFERADEQTRILLEKARRKERAGKTEGPP